MTEELQELMLDLLTKKASFGLDTDEQRQLDQYCADAGVTEDNSFEFAAAAIGLVDLSTEEPLPSHLHAKIIASADEYFDSIAQTASNAEPVQSIPDEEKYQKVFTIEPPRRSWNWLGWVVAAAACVALAMNVWFTRIAPTEISGVIKTPTPIPEKLTPEQELASLLASQPNVIKASWGAGNMKDLKEIGGDVVWSDEKQKGFMRLKGLPVNDKSISTYQLWIFDKTQDKATPIDGGTFDVDKDGEVVIPINAKLKAQGPELFAITVEKPGGVVVSKRDKIAALAKVETQPRSNT